VTGPWTEKVNGAQNISRTTACLPLYRWI